MDLSKLDAKGDVVTVVTPEQLDRVGGVYGTTATTGNSPVVGKVIDQKALGRLVNRRHPKYNDRFEHWNFVEATYEGGRDWFPKNIFRYLKEGDKEFAGRLTRAYRFNHSREVVDLLDKYLFRQETLRAKEEVPEFIEDFRVRSTRAGLGINELMRQVSKLSSIFGRVGIVVDSTAQEGATSVADAKARGDGVYAYIIDPRKILDYSVDDRGELNWILIEESYRDDEDPFGDIEPVRPRWRLWDKTSWTLIAERDIRGKRKSRTFEIKDTGTHDLGLVPVILHNHIITDEEWAAPGMIDDIAYLDRAVANYLSNLDAIIQDQTFSQLVMPAQGVLPGDENYNTFIEAGTKRIFTFDGEGGIAPQYISPDVKQAQLIVDIIQKIINEIYHTVGLAGERTKQDNALGIDNSSGVAKAYDFERVNSLLAAKADSLELTERQVYRLVGAWHDDDQLDPNKLVQYPDNFDVRTLYDEFDIAARLMLIEAPDETRRNQMISVIEKLFPMVPDKVQKAMLDELKDWPPEPDLMGDQAPAPGEKKATADNRQGQVTKKTETQPA